jgi:hypothetical protein
MLHEEERGKKQPGKIGVANNSSRFKTSVIKHTTNIDTAEKFDDVFLVLYTLTIARLGQLRNIPIYIHVSLRLPTCNNQ